MRTSIATVCLSGTLEEKLVAAAEAGFDGVEIFEPDLVASPSSPAEVRAAARDLGLTLDLYQPVRDIEGVDPETFAANLRRLDAKAALAAELGIDRLLMCSNVGTATVDDEAVVVDQLRAAADTAERHGVKVAYEALAWGRHVNRYTHAWRLVETADHPNLGTCLDSFHILSVGDDPLGIAAIPGNKIFFLQLADAPLMSLDVLSWSRHYRLFPGEGSFDLPRLLSLVQRTGYDGPMSLEVFNDVFRQADETRTAVEAMRSLLWLGDETARRYSSPVAVPDDAVPPAPGRALAILPGGEQPRGTTFVEVATADAAPVEELLGQLGLGRVGTHRHKRVGLWTLGEARVIVNAENPRYDEPAIAAIGVEASDPDAAYRRARRLRAPDHPRLTPPDDVPLLAVQAPDGTSVFLCEATDGRDPVWVREFLEEGAPRSLNTVGDSSVRIDHVNVAEPWQFFDEAVLFYQSVLGLDRVTATDVAAPSGLVRSQVMRSADNAVRLVLNVAPHALAGSGVGMRPALPQHVAFACDDIVSFARSARERGLDMLGVPANYYDDLAARFELHPDRIAELRSLDLLYDRDADGEFLHFYTATVGSVFFEVVQRIGGYDGYGAPNAAVRHATQYRRARENRDGRA